MRRLIIRFNSFPSWAFDLGSPPDLIWFLFFYVFRSGYFCTAVSDIYFGRMIMALYLFQVKLKIVVLMENKSPVFLSTERVFGFFPVVLRFIWSEHLQRRSPCCVTSCLLTWASPADLVVVDFDQSWGETLVFIYFYFYVFIPRVSSIVFFILKHFDNDVSCFEMLLFWWQFNY